MHYILSIKDRKKVNKKIKSILANFSPIFKFFFLLKGYEKGSQKQAKTMVSVVLVLQAPLGNFLA